MMHPLAKRGGHPGGGRAHLVNRGEHPMVKRPRRLHIIPQVAHCYAFWLKVYP